MTTSALFRLDAGGLHDRSDLEAVSAQHPKNGTGVEPRKKAVCPGGAATNAESPRLNVSVPGLRPRFAPQPERAAAAQQFRCIALILTGFFRLRNDTGGDKFGFLLLSAGCRFILRADAVPLLSDSRSCGVSGLDCFAPIGLQLGTGLE